MKAVILAGGFGTRISEESHLKPKPMIEIGEKPILWHIMKIYSAYGINDFIICCGYKGYVVKEYFANYFLHTSDITIDVQANDIQVHRKGAEPWKITLVNTGVETMTGGRLKRVEKYLDNETFCFTYGDGIAQLEIDKLIEYHRKQGRLATLIGIQMPGRFGVMEVNNNCVVQFQEKPQNNGTWTNGGFFVLEPDVLALIDGDETIWEKGPLEKLAQDNQLAIYKHYGFWAAMDTLRDKNYIESLWNSGRAPWKVW